MRNIYPRTLPEYLREFPWFLKGKAAQAADMFLSSRCDYDGVRACEMAAILLDEEIISEDSVYSFAERMEILTFAHEVDDWYADYGKALKDPVVGVKVDFVFFLASCYAKRFSR